MTDLNKIVDELSTLTVIEAAELSKLLEEKWGVSAAAPVAVAAARLRRTRRNADALCGVQEHTQDLTRREVVLLRMHNW